MSKHPTGPVSGTWVSSLTVIKTQSPNDAAKYTCRIDNGQGQPDEQTASLAING